MYIFKEFIGSLWHMMLEGSFYMLMGFMLAGILHVYLPGELLPRLMGTSTIGGILRGVAVGAPLPICSCGVLPAAMAMKDKKVRNSTVAAFLVSTPETGIDSILTSYAFLDLPLTIIKPVAAIISGIVAGIAVHIFGDDKKAVPLSNKETKHHCTSCKFSEKEDNMTFAGCCALTETKIEEGCSCKLSYSNKIVHIFKYGFIKLLGEISFSLLIGFILAAFIGSVINTIIPQRILNSFAGNDLLSLFVMLVISLPVYVCSTASIPLAAGFLLMGFTPGSVVVFLLIGPATNMASISVIMKVFGKRFLTVFLASIVTISVILGYVVNNIYRYILTEPITNAIQNHQHHGILPFWLRVSSTIIMISLIITGIYNYKIKH